MFDAERDQKLEELFQLAADLNSADREQFFDRHCGEDAELRTALMELLRQDEEGTKDFLQSPVLASRRTKSEGEDELPSPGSSFMPERIGRYRIIERVGEGGMGSVYLAEQEHPVRRQVALKIVKPGMDTERVIQRFEIERQSLALMDHPGIARIFDGGATETGRPYFAMEYAPGLPITEFCDSENLSMRERLQLFLQVCEAVQHAHHKGIIHRDIKPTNVLVSRRDDGRVVPKVIDFGIARATSESAEERRHSTRAQEVVGTCYYMSPEQADPDSALVDTRTDIYALGVVLYEILTGVLPFDSDTFRGKTAVEVQTILRTVEPAQPSQRVTRLGETTTMVAERRGVARHALVSHLTGDLDWITMRAMNKDPARRYSSAAGLAADLRNHLTDQPVMAGPPGASYRVRKFIRRNRLKVVSGLMILLTLIAGIIGTTWSMLESSRTRDLALQAKAQAEIAQREAGAQRLEAERQRREAELKRDEALASKVAAEFAEAESDRLRLEAESEHQNAQAAQLAEAQLRSVAEIESKQSKAITEFLVDTLSLIDLDESNEPEPSLETMLLSASHRVEIAFRGSPEGEAIVRRVLGEALHSLGYLEKAESHLRRAMDIQRGLAGIDNSEIYETMTRLSRVYAESDNRDAYELYSRASEIGANLIGMTHSPLRHELQHLIDDVSNIDIEGATERLSFLRDRLPEHLGEHDEHWTIVADIFENLGRALGYQWGALEGVEFLEEALVIRRREYPATHPKLASVLNALVGVLNSHGKYVEAEGLIGESLMIYEAAFPPDHWLLSETRSLLGECLSGQGLVVAAEDYLLLSHEIITRERGAVSRASIDSTYRLVKHFQNSSRPALADDYRVVLAEALAFSRNAPWHWGKQSAAFRVKHQSLVDAIESLDALVLEGARTLDFSETYQWELASALERVIQLRHEHLEDDDPLSIIVVRLLSGYLNIDLAQTYEIDRMVCHEVLLVLSDHRDRLPQPVAAALKLLGRNALRVEGNPARAEGYFGRAWELQKLSWGFSDQATLSTLNDLVWSLMEQGRFADAETWLAETWEDCMVSFGPRHTSTDRVLRYLANLYRVWDRPTMLETYLEKHLREDLSDDNGAARLDHWARLAVRVDGFSERLYELAMAAATRADKLSPSNPRYASTVGKALFRLGRLEEARTRLEKSNEHSRGRFPDNFAVLAMIHQRMGNESEMENAWLESERIESVTNHRHLNHDEDLEIHLFVDEAKAALSKL